VVVCCANISSEFINVMVCPFACPEFWFGVPFALLLARGLTAMRFSAY
jgi:hypothetical protein